MRIDTNGSPVSLVKIDTQKAYSNIYTLLQSYINNNDLCAWECLKEHADYIYDNITILLDTLDKETDFKCKVYSQLAEGKKLLFKPNIVAVNVIDNITHGAAAGAPVSFQWIFLAALMRYFHDSLNISYYQMCMGEGSQSDDFISKLYSKTAGRTLSHESILEGKNGDFYGGYGFYFVRKYLYDRHPLEHTDNPMNGYENSVNGEYLPPGKANDRLMVYDLNDLSDSDRGRTFKIPNGGNYHRITMHKAVIGGEGCDKENYPGCVLINLPILKMHFMDIITNAIKNLGIGLYPTSCPDHGTETHKYAHHTNFKSKLPHSRWVMELDENTFLPRVDKNGNYIREKTLGFSGTQCDIIRGLQDQGVLIIHVCDAINIVNLSHMSDGKSTSVPEGLIFSSLDPLALDYCCSRYCFNQLPMETGKELMKKNNWSTEFVQSVPLPYVKDGNICTTTGYDSPLFRYPLHEYAEEHGVGQKKYYVTGLDTLTNTPIASVKGHIGRLEKDCFTELITDTLYYNPVSMLHHLQLTTLSYAKCCDTLAGTSIYDTFMNLYDENKDGVIDYDEKGYGLDNAKLSYLSNIYNTLSLDANTLKVNFFENRFAIKYGCKHWNKENIDFLKGEVLISITAQAYKLSKSKNLHADLYISDMCYGQGQWPSWKTASYFYYTTAIFGSTLFKHMKLDSLYGWAFQYADISSNNSYYTSMSKPLSSYFKDVMAYGEPLPFTLYLPKGWSKLEDITVPNVVETSDKAKLFTVSFKKAW